jgi:hypothetical protein
VGSNGNVLSKWGKTLRSPSPRAKIRPTINSTTFHQRTIVAMFTTFSHHGLDTVQLMETALPQSSPQLAGPSPISPLANGLDIRNVHC